MKWKTAKGKEIPIKELEQNHLENIRDMLKRWKWSNQFGEIGLSAEKQAILRDYWEPIHKEIKRRLHKEYNEINENYNI